ncbi:hypothetical protein HYU19_03575 [Candidatus Woesearchaeota archaeon]|nr:hypothetical protein [Candidatus Woesearchaeota archaeon]
MKLILKKVGVLSAAKLQGVISAVLGIFVGIIYSIIIFFTFLLQGSALTGLLLGILALIGASIGYGLLGFVFGALGTWLYNVFAEKIGGIELTFEKE